MARCRASWMVRQSSQEVLLQGHRFPMLSGTGYGLFYCKGAGVIVERDPGADPAEEELWLNGSVYAAIAEINGFFFAA